MESVANVGLPVNNKKWFDKECNGGRIILRNISNQNTVIQMMKKLGKNITILYNGKNHFLSLNASHLKIQILMNF